MFLCFGIPMCIMNILCAFHVFMYGYVTKLPRLFFMYILRYRNIYTVTVQNYLCIRSKHCKTFVLVWLISRKFSLFFQFNSLMKLTRNFLPKKIFLFLCFPMNTFWCRRSFAIDWRLSVDSSDVLRISHGQVINFQLYLSVTSIYRRILIIVIIKLKAKKYESICIFSTVKLFLQNQITRCYY